MNAHFVAMTILSLLALSASAPGTAPVNTVGELAEVRAIEVAAGDAEGSLVITGAGAVNYRLEWQADSALQIRFPGARLTPGPGIAALGARVSDRRPDTLTVALEGRHLAAVIAGDQGLTLSFSGTAQRPGGEYRIGVGDKLRLAIHGDEEASEREIRVVGEGTISVPYIGEVMVQGLTEAEAAAEITNRLAAGYLREPRLSLEVVEYQSQWVHVTGQVKDPGRYYLRGVTTLVDILAEAGGLKADAGNEIQIARSSSAGPDRLIHVRKDDLYLTDDPSGNPLLRSGDTITVADAQYFFIKGEVKNPGRYPVEDGTTILRAISLAGGFDQFANQKKVELLREKGGESVRLVINIERIENRKADDVRVLPGDIINVKARFL